MIYLELFLGFLEVGCFAFGGAYAVIPMIRDVVLRYGWITEDALTTMIAVSESTPGPIIVNLATYVGAVHGGFWGAVLSTFGAVFPAFLIILLIMVAMQNLMNRPAIQAMLKGMKPCLVGIIMATGITMILSRCFPGGAVDSRALIMTALLCIAAFGTKGKVSSIGLIGIGAVLGLVSSLIP